MIVVLLLGITLVYCSYSTAVRNWFRVIYAQNPMSSASATRPDSDALLAEIWAFICPAGSETAVSGY